MAFRDFIQHEMIQEALRIVKKNVDKQAEKAKYDAELNKEKMGIEDDHFIGKVGNYKVIETYHLSDTRDYEKKPRNYGMTKADYLRVIELFVNNHRVHDGKRYHLFYKDKQGTYSNLVVQVNGDDIVVVTIMQMKKKDVNKYFSKPGELRLTLENSEEIFILLDLTI